MLEVEQEILEKKQEDITNFLTLVWNVNEHDLKAAVKMKAEQTRNFYTLAADSNPELKNNNVPNNNYYYCNKKFNQIRSG